MQLTVVVADSCQIIRKKPIIFRRCAAASTASCLNVKEEIIKNSLQFICRRDHEETSSVTVFLANIITTGKCLP